MCLDNGNASQGADNTSVRAVGVLSVGIPGGDPELLNGGRKSVQSREICRRGRFPASPCMVGGCASHSIIPGHHRIPRFLNKSQHFTVHLFRPWRPGSARGSDGGPRRFTEVVPTPHAYSGQCPVKTKRARARSCASVVTRKRPSLNRAKARFMGRLPPACRPKDYTSHKLALESAVTRSRGVDVGVAGGA